MGLFDDVGRFFESRLEEFLKAHPDLELQALDEQLRQQETDTVRLLAESRAEQQRLQKSILATAEEVKTWHLRVEKAQRYSRPDLVKGAQDREAALLSQGNQLWGQMKGGQERIQKLEELHTQIQKKRAEVKTKLRDVQTQQHRAKAEQWSGWTKPSEPWGDLDRKFRELEVEEEINRLKHQS